MLAERTVTVQQTSGPHAQALENQRRPEILVAGDADRVDHVPLTQLDAVERGQMLGIGLHRLVGDLYIEVALALEVVAQVLGAFVEQVLVHRTLLVDGHQFLHAGPG